VSGYFDAVAHRRLLREYPIGPAFLETVARMDRAALRRLQDQRFRHIMKRAWHVPFYRRLWTAHGVGPRHVRSLDDIGRLPAYSKSDLMRSVEEHPPFGDYHGLEQALPPGPGAPPVIFHTTSGTTGRPQPLFWGPRSRELQNLVLARGYLFQGVRPADVVQSVYGHGVVNGGHYVRETFLHWVPALFISAGTGVETRSRTQVEYLRDFGVTVLVGFVDYIRRLAEVAREMGLEPGRDLRPRLIIGHLGRESADELSRAWGGAEVFDWYGVGDTGLIAAEGPDHAGLYVMEDAHHVDIVDPDTHAPVPEGETGNICVTVLGKDDVFPVVKLRGINVYPTGVGAMLRREAGATGEFLCRVRRRDGRDEMTVAVEVRGDAAERAALAAAYRDRLRAGLGVEVLVELVAPGALASATGVESRQKPVRLIDERGQGRPESDPGERGACRA
jgi:phenylacetate-CoA ligase